MELPGIEPAYLPGNLPAELPFRSTSVRFSPVRYLRFRSRVLTASRAVTYRIDLLSHPVELATERRGATRQPTATSGRCR